MSVLIVGGGMTGATLALAISRLTGGALPVHLIEAQDPHSSRHPALTTGRSPSLRAPASSWRVSVSGNASPNARRPSSEYTSATAVMPGL